mgnify:CR=1 FL=1
MPFLYAVINSGQAVSGNLDLTKYGLSAIAIPPVASATDLLVQGAFTTTSADFVRLQASRPNTDVRFSIGTGSNMVLWPADLPSPPYARLETSVTQTDVRTFTALVR